MTVDTQKLRELIAEVSAEPWKPYCRNINYQGGAWPESEFLQWEVDGPVEPSGRGSFYQADAELIAATRNALPALLDEIDRLRAVILAIDSLRGPFMSDDDVASVWKLVDAALNPPAPPQGEKDA